MSCDRCNLRVAHVISSLGTGGAEAVLYRLVTSDRAHHHTVITMLDGGRHAALLRDAGVRVIELGFTRGKAGLSQFFNLRRALRDVKPDLVQTWMYHSDLLGGLAARSIGIRSIVWGIRRSEVDSRLPIGTRIVWRLNALLSRWLPARIAVCGYRAAEVHARNGYDARRMVVIQNGYDLTRFRRSPLDRGRMRKVLEVPQNGICVGTVARYHPDKDHRTLIEALRSIRASGREFTLVLAGPGMLRENAELRQLLEGAGLAGCTRLLGPQDDIPGIMNALDVHVLSSRVEGFPNVICEAMACGTLCVSTDVGDAAQIIGDLGVVCAPGDATALAAAIEASFVRLNENDLAEKLRNRVVEMFSLETMRSRYGELWCSVASEGGNVNLRAEW